MFLDLKMLSLVIQQLVLSIDNVLVIGVMVMYLSAKERIQILMLGLSASVVLKILFALGLRQLMNDVTLFIAAAFFLYKFICGIGGESSDRDVSGASRYWHAVFAVMMFEIWFSFDSTVVGVAIEPSLVRLVVATVVVTALVGIAVNLLQAAFRAVPSLDEGAYLVIGFFGLTLLLKVVGIETTDSQQLSFTFLVVGGCVVYDKSETGRNVLRRPLHWLSSPIVALNAFAGRLAKHLARNANAD